MLTIEKCPGCGTGNDSTELFPVTLMGHACSLVRCLECGLAYKNLQPGPEDLDKLYSTNYVHFNSEQKAGAADINSARAKLKTISRLYYCKNNSTELHLLDIGCGSGQFVRIMKSLGVNAEGIDPNLPEALTDKVIKNGIPSDISKNSYDAVVLLNVVEHLVDPLALFKDVYNILNPQGVLLLTCPYGNSLAMKKHRDRWTHLALDEHLLFWTPESLLRCLNRAGFTGNTDVRISGSPFPYGIVSEPGPGLPSDTDAETHSDSHSSLAGNVQAKVWKFARWLQAHEKMANVARSIINITRTGDYLEYAIVKNKSG